MSSKYILFGFLVGLAISLNGFSYTKVEATKHISGSIIKSKSNSSIWKHLRSEFKLKHFHNHAGVQKTVQEFLREDYQLPVILERGAPYIHFILQELKKRDLPAELVFLPFIESEYKPTALSHKSASGLWQLMPATGKILGLQQNQYYDGRNDIYASTKAALNHISYLNKKFNGDWLITLSAYNAGEGTMMRAIEKNRAAGKSTDYWSLDIPYAETRNYVLRFLAIVNIIENSDQYDLELPEIANEPALIYVKLDEKTDLKHAAKLTGLSLNEIYAYNPGIKKHVTTTPPNGPHHLMLPVEEVHPQKIAMLQKTTDATA